MPMAAVLLWSALVLYSIDAFNIDTKNALVHSHSNGHFGYSIDFYHEQKGMPVLIVGAPEAHSTNPNLVGIRRPGAVFACSVNKKACREVFIDKKQGNEMRLNGSFLAPIEDKTDQYFGATVKSNKKHDRIIMCAPKYKYFFSKFEVIEPVGTCFYAENGFQKAEEFASCRQEPARHGRHRFGYGQCGFSAAVPDKFKKGDERVFIGAPGVWYWQGAIFSQNVRNVTDRPNTEYGGKEYDHDMMGYATATGDLDGDGIDDIVAGVPRGNDLIGKLVLYTSHLKMMVNLTDTISPQPGEYCGSALAVQDVNNDGKDDIIVGCPFFTDYSTVKDAKTQERKPQYDVGKVIVFFQTAPGVFDKSVAIVGQDQWGRFGWSVAATGDLNKDGYNDFIVGAPYAGENQDGAVYVIHGSKEGVREKPTQKIEAGKIAPGTKTFGFSVAAGIDVDGNGMPDIAVGSWKSNRASVLLTKPIVKVNGQTDADSVTINVEDKNCDVDSKLGKQSCRTINTCLKYDGVGDTANELEFTLHYDLDNQSPEPRAYFLQKDIKSDRNIQIAPGSKTKDHPNSITKLVRLEKGRQKCFQQRFFASSTMRDKLSPIHWTVNYTYEESKTGRVRGDKLEPAIDTTLPLSFQNKISIANNCGKDEVCVPDLKVTAVTDRETFLLGTTDNMMQINVTVENGGEDSYETKLYFDVPEGFEYSGIEAVGDKTKTTAPSCSPTSENPDENGKWTFACELGNPLPANTVLSNIVKITANEKKPPLKPIEIKAHVNSTNEEGEGTTHDNYFSYTVPVDFKNQLNLNGRSNPEQLDFSTRNKTDAEVFYDSEIGPVVSHLYQVLNRGPSEIDSATLDIFWPSFSTEGNHLLYIITEPVVNPPNKGKCRVKQIQNINPLNLRLTNEHLPTEPPEPTRDYASKEDQNELYESGENDNDNDDVHEQGESVDDERVAVQQPGANGDTKYVGGEERDPSKTYTYERNKDGQPNQGVGQSHYTYEENKNYQPQGQWKYVPDDDQEFEGEDDEDWEEGDEEEEDRGGSRVKRSPKKKKKGKKEERRDDDIITGDEKARFADLREAVRLSKEAGGVTDYKGVLSRASVDCNSLRCTHIECDLYDLGAEEDVLVEIFARLYKNTLVDERNPGSVVSSLGLVRVTSTKYNWPHKPTLVRAVTTSLNAINDDASASGIPWWWWVIAVLIALLILGLIILLLWRCGFFKRNRPHTEHAELTAHRDPDGRYADSKTRYNPPESYDRGQHGQML